MTPDDLKAHPLVGKVVLWTHGPNVLVGPATHYDDEDDELFIVPDGLVHGHYWVPASECSPLAALSAQRQDHTKLIAELDRAIDACDLYDAWNLLARAKAALEGKSDE